MRFEKLNDDKIRITLNREDLEKKDINLHDFMSSSIESQDLFFDMLNEAEKEIGFVTKNYQIRIEALAVASGDFIITVTRSLPSNNHKEDNALHKASSSKKVKVRRKQTPTDTANALYAFPSFEEFCQFCLFLQCHKIPYSNIAKNIVLYVYKDVYYVALENINIHYPCLKKLFSNTTEFATYLNYSNLWINKLKENGKIVMKNNAIRTCLKYFA